MSRMCRTLPRSLETSDLTVRDAWMPHDPRGLRRSHGIDVIVPAPTVPLRTAVSLFDGSTSDVITAIGPLGQTARSGRPLLFPQPVVTGRLEEFT